MLFVVEFLEPYEGWEFWDVPVGSLDEAIKIFVDRDFEAYEEDPAVLGRERAHYIKLRKE